MGKEIRNSLKITGGLLFIVGIIGLSVLIGIFIQEHYSVFSFYGYIGVLFVIFGVTIFGLGTD